MDADAFRSFPLATAGSHTQLSHRDARDDSFSHILIFLFFFLFGCGNLNRVFSICK